MPGKSDGPQVETGSRPDASCATIAATIVTGLSRNPQVQLIRPWHTRPMPRGRLAARAA
jgi:hypothetical protein